MARGKAVDAVAAERQRSAREDHVTDVRELAARLLHGQRLGLDPDSMVAGALADGADPEVMAAARAMVPAPGSLAARLAERQAAAAAERQRQAYLNRLRLRAETTAGDVEVERAEAEASGRSGSKADVALRRAAAAARQEYLAALSGGPEHDTEAARSVRRAARHAARTRQPLPAGHRTELARQLADSIETFSWGGEVVPYLRLPRPRGLVTDARWSTATLTGTDARTGVVAVGTAYRPVDPDLAVLPDGMPVPVAPPRDAVLPDGRPMGADLTHLQHGAVLVSNGEVLAERDAQWDEAADAARTSARTRVRSAADMRAAVMGGGMAEVRAELRAEADALIDMAAEADAERERADRKAARSGGAAAADYRPVPAMPVCGACQRQHAAIEACGAA